MKNVCGKIRTAGAALALAMTFGPSAVLASTAASGEAKTGFSKVVEPIVKLLDSLVAPLLLIVGSIGTLYCILLGVKFAKAEEPQDREKAKSHLKNAIIGFVLIFVLMLALNLLMPAMVEWVNANSETAAAL